MNKNPQAGVVEIDRWYYTFSDSSCGPDVRVERDDHGWLFWFENDAVTEGQLREFLAVVPKVGS